MQTSSGGSDAYSSQTDFTVTVNIFTGTIVSVTAPEY